VHTERDGASSHNQCSGSGALLSILLLALLAAVAYGIAVTPALMQKDFSRLAQDDEEKTEALKTKNHDELVARQKNLEQQVAKIDSGELRSQAANHYKRELEERKSYNNRFALTPREKAQLQMQALASDATKSFHEAIRSVAGAASPKGADINVRESTRGIALHIDFDMSAMTSGEDGTRTKHHTKESLRKEVISIISRVTNDIFQFCKDLDLASIHVGCRHYVKTTYQYGSTQDENTILYKIRIQKDRIPQLSSSPFLDVYSTTTYFEVDEDNFEGIEIITTRS